MAAIPGSRIDYSERIPNNVDLATDRRLQRALESWQPNFLTWWRELGPTVFQENEIYLRTAVAVGREGWAHFDYVRMPDYRWGIFLAEPDPDRVVSHGQHKGEPVWQSVPGEYRSVLRRLIVVQGDTEPASVELQRHLGAFNERTPDWLSFFLFTYFTDRDGKFQLGTLKESAFDPLARTCEFMLKEEAHHMFVGTTGVDRTVQRTAELMKEHDTAEVYPHGGIPLDVIQRYINFHFSVSMDLFGSETSTNVANYYTAGLKGRWSEERRRDDHKLTDDSIMVEALVDGSVGEIQVAALVGLNTDLRREYISDCQNGVNRWNKILEDAGLAHRLKLPHVAFNRRVGALAGIEATPDGEMISADEWQRRKGEWLPTSVDKSYVRSLMQPVHERGKIAAWIAPPRQGINGTLAALV